MNYYALIYMSAKTTNPIWIARDYKQCSGCRLCEVACSLRHEGKIWPEASRVRVFMLVPGAEIPHLCAQCHDYPCLHACPEKAISFNEKIGSVMVDRKKCTACGDCIKACPGRVPYIHPTKNYAVICDLCGGDPQCVKICQRGRWNALWTASRTPSVSYRLYARRPEDVTKELAEALFGAKKAKELV